MVTGASTEPSAKGSSASRRDWSPIGPSTCGLAAGSSATAVTLARPARKADASKAMRIRTPSNHRREPLFILVAGFDFCFTVICLLPSVSSLELAEVRSEDAAAHRNQDEGKILLGNWARLPLAQLAAPAIGFAVGDAESPGRKGSYSPAGTAEQTGFKPYHQFC